jgi:hypothetical protein
MRPMASDLGGLAARYQAGHGGAANAKDDPRMLAAARGGLWALAGDAAPGADGSLITVDIDVTIVTSCSSKDQATPTWKKTFGFRPPTVFADHGPEGSGEPLAFLLRPGDAGPNTASEHIDATHLVLAQLPRGRRLQALIRADSAGTQDFLTRLA